MVDLYRQFLAAPTARRYRAAMAAMTLSAEAGAPSLLALENAFREGRFATVQTLAEQWSRYFALSPRFHRLAALAAFELGDAQDAEVERFAADACLTGVTASGDGSQQQPYLIQDRADAGEVLHQLGLKVKGQRLVEQNGRWCDVFEVGLDAKKTQSIWFELASFGAVAAKQAGKQRAERTRKVTV